MGIPTHMMEYSSGGASVKGGGSSRLQFVSPLRQLNGNERWFITFYALPAGKSYEEVRHKDTPEYIQAGGRTDKLMLDIRKPGGEHWGADWVRYIIGHEHSGNPAIDVAIELPRGPEFVSGCELFEAEEAGEIFYTYYKTNDIPHGFALRAVEGYTADGQNIDLRGA